MKEWKKEKLEERKREKKRGDVEIHDNEKFIEDYFNNNIKNLNADDNNNNIPGNKNRKKNKKTHKTSNKIQNKKVYNDKNSQNIENNKKENLIFVELESSSTWRETNDKVQVDHFFEYTGHGRILILHVVGLCLPKFFSYQYLKSFR
ncbi:hypothetical protein HELRODRAFT_166121 [Helobdella robusta]|uniref:Uncharacterized protein n=1 Tax=Helobdella robusta TaxID=6412 RepID=T1EXT3_HELRO|nr:hypothetical protein HELRODRAFT_166121 [Helobdella robusta]ESN90455.1 hypothetical protein HELRODRAFT_166121 [Helobdella robusta]